MLGLGQRLRPHLTMVGYVDSAAGPEDDGVRLERLQSDVKVVGLATKVR